MDLRTRLRRIGDALWVFGLIELVLGPLAGVGVGFSHGYALRGLGLGVALGAVMLGAGLLLFALGRPKSSSPRHPYRG